MDDTNSVLLEAKTRGSGKLVAYGNRIETTKRRLLTLGLTKKKQTYYYSSIVHSDLRGKTVSIKCGSFDGTAYTLKKKDARKLKQIIDEHTN